MKIFVLLTKFILQITFQQIMLILNQKNTINTDKEHTKNLEKFLKINMEFPAGLIIVPN